MTPTTQTRNMSNRLPCRTPSAQSAGISGTLYRIYHPLFDCACCALFFSWSRRRIVVAYEVKSTLPERARDRRRAGEPPGEDYDQFLKVTLMRRRSHLIISLALMAAFMGAGSISSPRQTPMPTAGAISAGQTPMAYLPRLEVRLRKVHLVRPDLIPYPIAIEVDC